MWETVENKVDKARIVKAKGEETEERKEKKKEKIII